MPVSTVRIDTKRRCKLQTSTGLCHEDAEASRARVLLPLAVVVHGLSTHNIAGINGTFSGCQNQLLWLPLKPRWHACNPPIPLGCLAFKEYCADVANAKLQGLVFKTCASLQHVEKFLPKQCSPFSGMLYICGQRNPCTRGICHDVSWPSCLPEHACCHRSGVYGWQMSVIQVSFNLSDLVLAPQCMWRCCNICIVYIGAASSRPRAASHTPLRSLPIANLQVASHKLFPLLLKSINQAATPEAGLHKFSRQELQMEA